MNPDHQNIRQENSFSYSEVLVSNSNVPGKIIIKLFTFIIVFHIMYINFFIINIAYPNYYPYSSLNVVESRNNVEQ